MLLKFAFQDFYKKLQKNSKRVLILDIRAIFEAKFQSISLAGRGSKYRPLQNLQYSKTLF